MLATTWSNPSSTKANTGHQICNSGQYINQMQNRTFSRTYSADLREEFSSTTRQEASQTHQPVGTDCLQEDLVPLGYYGLGRCDVEKFFAVYCRRQDSTVSNNDASHKQCTSKVAKEGKQPMSQHQQDGGTAVEGSQGGVHETSSAEICPSHDDNHQTEGEDKGSEHSDDTRSILV